MKYLNNGVQVNAIQWNGQNKDEIIRFFGDDPTKMDYQSANGIYMIYGDQLYLRMANGQLMVNIGDYVVQTPRLTYYPCNPNDFERDHKPIGESQEKMLAQDIPAVDPIAMLKQFNEVSIESIETSPINVSILEGKYLVMKQGQIHLCFYPDQFVLLQKTINQIVNGLNGVVEEPEPTPEEKQVSADPSNTETEFEWDVKAPEVDNTTPEDLAGLSKNDNEENK